MSKKLVVLLALVVSAACHDTPTTPTPTPTPTSVPGSFTLSGAVTETWPTSTTAVGGATISVTVGREAGLSTVADASGHFTLTGLQAGPMTLRASATSYDDAVQTITISADRPGFAFEMNPTAATVDERQDDTVTATSPICDGPDSTTRLPCQSYVYALHAEGRFDAVLNWDDRIEVASALALEVIRQTPTGPQQVGLSRVSEGNPNREEVVIATLAPGLYSVRVLYQRDLGPQPFVLTVRHPR